MGARSSVLLDGVADRLGEFAPTLPIGNIGEPGNQIRDSVAVNVADQ
jgi:hypothetical protein